MCLSLLGIERSPVKLYFMARVVSAILMETTDWDRKILGKPVCWGGGVGCTCVHVYGGY